MDRGGVLRIAVTVGFLVGSSGSVAAQQLAVSPTQPTPSDVITVTVEGRDFVCPDMSTFVGDGRIDILCQTFAPVVAGSLLKGDPLFSIDVGPLAPGAYDVNLIGVGFPGIPTPAPAITELARTKVWVIDPATGLRAVQFVEGLESGSISIELDLMCGLPSDPDLSYGYSLERVFDDGVISLSGFPVNTAQECAPGQETWTQSLGPLTLEPGRYLVSFLTFFGFGEGEIKPGFETALVVEPPDDEKILVQGGRFSLQATWTKADGETGPARGRRLPGADDSASFYFFRPGNTELVVKVLDGCQANERFWVFAAGLTNLGVSLTVTNEDTGDSETYVHDQGTPFVPVIDRTRFDCLGVVIPLAVR